MATVVNDSATDPVKPQPSVPGVIEWDHLDKRKYYAWGPFLNLGTTLVLYPTKLLKVRLQADSQKLYKGTADALVKTVRHEGPRALYKGFLPNSWTIVANQGYITTYEYTKSAARPYCKSEPIRNLGAGVFASCVSQCLRVPADVVAQRLMVQGAGDAAVATAATSYHPRHTATTIARSLLKTDGIRGFFRGYSVSLLTDAPSSGIFWMLYGGIRRLQVGDGEGAAAPVTFSESVASQALASASAGGLAGLVTNPFDVIKTNVQLHKAATPPATARSVYAELTREEGLRWMGRGASARVLHMAVNSTILIVCYEAVKYFSLAS